MIPECFAALKISILPHRIQQFQSHPTNFNPTRQISIPPNKFQSHLEIDLFSGGQLNFSEFSYAHHPGWTHCFESYTWNNHVLSRNGSDSTLHSPGFLAPVNPNCSFPIWKTTFRSGKAFAKPFHCRVQTPIGAGNKSTVCRRSICGVLKKARAFASSENVIANCRS